MLKKILFLNVLLVYFNLSLQDDDTCPLTVSHGRVQDTIIQYGKITEKWEITPYIATPMTDLEYFHTLRIMNDTNTAPPITVNLITNDTNISKATASVSDQNSLVNNPSFVQKTIEIKYNCDENKKGWVQMKLTISTKGCQDMNLSWVKICRPFDHLPTVNIGTILGKFDIVRNGKFVQNYMTHQYSEKKVIFPKDFNVLRLYVAYAKPGQSITMSTPKIIYDESEMSPFFFGQLKEGGRIGNEPMLLETHLICLPFRKKVTDLQIDLEFDNYDSVRLFISKECDTLGEIQEYFTILYVIYWYLFLNENRILLILIIIFLVAIFFYYMKKNEITLNDIIEKTIETVKSCFNGEKKKQHRSNTFKEELYEENDLIDIKITTNKLNNNNNITKQGTNNSSSSYGGI